MENKLAKKLLVKPGKKLLFVNAPVDYLLQLDPLPAGTTVATGAANGTYDFIQLFVLNRAQLKQDMKKVHKCLQKDTVFWITYPKKASGIVTDLEMMTSWDELTVYGLSGVAAAAINDHWTAIRFRPVEQVKKSDTANAEIEKNDFGAYIDVKNKVIMLPPGLLEAIHGNQAARNFFEKLSYTNKKEYVVWVLTAKQDKTRTERIEKTVGKLLAGKKNPAEK